MLIAVLGCGILVRHKYVRWRYFRKAPEEAAARPLVDAPDGERLALSPRGEHAPARLENGAVAPIELVPRTDGALVWEAEWANRIAGSYECLPAADAGGGLALWSRQGSGRSLQMHYHRPRRHEGDLGVAEYHFNLSVAGRYRLYMRVLAPDHCGNSCWVGLDVRRRLHCFPDGFDSDFEGRRLHWPDEMFRRWLWLADTGRVFDLDAGAHFLRVEVREDGLAIDQVALVPEEGAEPSGMLRPSIIPGIGSEKLLAAGSVDTGDEYGMSPFDVSLAVEHQCLPGDGEATAHAYLRVRSNVEGRVPVTVRLAAAGADLRPGPELSFDLNAAAPFACIPVEVVFAAGRGAGPVALIATADSPAWKGRTVSRSRRIERPIPWRMLGPVDAADDAVLREKLMMAKSIDFSMKPLDDKPGLAWRQVLSPEHFGPFGALDFLRVFGSREECVVYAAAVIEVRSAGTYRVIAAGDDTLHLRCDGVDVVRDEYERTLTDTLRPVEIKLTEGSHLLVARVQQRTGAWEMTVRFETMDGGPAKDIVGISL